jgi:Tfp pilus assembly protein PilV
MHSAKSPSPNPKRRRQRGITLIEAVTTAALLGIGLLGLSASSMIVTKTAKSADMTSAATSLATQELELLRSKALNDAALTPGNYNGGSFTPAGGANGTIALSWVISAKDSPSWGLKTATVTATWTDNKTHTVTMAAYVRCATVPC